MGKIRNKAKPHGSGTCNICGVFFRKLQFHKSKGCRPRFCGICNIYFNQPCAYQMHLYAVHGKDKGNRLICPICRKQIESIKILQTHMERLHNTVKTKKELAKYVKCDMCNHRVHPEQLFEHVTDCHRKLCHGNLNLSPVDPVTCSTCKKIIPKASHYAVHMHSRHGLDFMGSELSPTLKCNQCSFATIASQRMLIHRTAHLTQEQIQSTANPWKCASCCYLFDDMKDATSHKANCSPDLPLVCALCELAFTQLSHFHGHFETYSHKMRQDKELYEQTDVDKRFFCDVCNCDIQHGISHQIHTLSKKHQHNLTILNQKTTRPTIVTMQRHSHGPSSTSTKEADIVIGLPLSVVTSSHDDYKKNQTHTSNKRTTDGSIALNITSAEATNCHYHHIELRTDRHDFGNRRYYRETQRSPVIAIDVPRQTTQTDTLQHVSTITIPTECQRCDWCNRDFNCPMYTKMHRKICSGN